MRRKESGVCVREASVHDSCSLCVGQIGEGDGAAASVCRLA